MGAGPALRTIRFHLPFCSLPPFFWLKVELEGDTPYSKAVRLSAAVARGDGTTGEGEVVSVSSIGARARPIAAVAAASVHTSTGRVMVAGTKKTHRVIGNYNISASSINFIIINPFNNPSLK